MIHKTTRSILSVLLAALLLVTSTPLTPAFAGGGGVSLQSESGEGRGLTGDGTKSDPYQIGSADDLRAFAEKVNGGETDASAVLTADIDLNPGFTFKEDGSYSGPAGVEPQEWTPIGNSSRRYSGNFDGNEKTISGLYIDSDADYQGLFGYVSSSGTVKDLSVSGSVSGGWCVGGVVGNNYSGIVENCYNIGKVSGTGVAGGTGVGGVVGGNDSGTVKNCYNIGAVSGGESVGGVVGDNGGTVENCYNTGEVSAIRRYVGGVVGWSDSGTVKNCYNTGKVSGPDSGFTNAVGGVVGYNISSCTVENCHNTGAVNSSGNYVGGVVGHNISSVTNCYNTGTVSGPDSVSGSYVGGVVGLNDGSVTNCYYQQHDPAIFGIGGTTGDNSSQTAAKSLEDFHSGEVAWLLENGQAAGSSQVWGQSNLTTPDSWPTLIALDKNAKTVYKVITDYGYVEQPDNVSYTNNPAEPAAPSRDGYTFEKWQMTEEEGNTITYTAKWTAEEPPYTGKYSYELTTSVGDHGSLTVDRYATEGDKVTIDVTPDQAYKLDELVVTANGKDVELTANSDGTYTFTMPSADVRITATFAEDPDWTEPEEPTTDVSDLFIDIARDAWYKDAIQYAYDNGLMTGVSATEFAPEQTTTRAMIVSILARLEGVTTAEAAGFADVNDNDWYATAVNWAANVGVVNGYEDGTFQPNTAITREQLAAILMNYAAYKGEDVSNRADLTSYTDQPSTWAEEAISWSVAEGLLTGVTADTLQPQGAATRAQVAAILQRFLSE